MNRCKKRGISLFIILNILLGMFTLSYLAQRTYFSKKGLWSGFRYGETTSVYPTDRLGAFYLTALGALQKNSKQSFERTNNHIYSTPLKNPEPIYKMYYVLERAELWLRDVEAMDLENERNLEIAGN